MNTKHACGWLLAALMALALPAQTVRVANHSGMPFSGWIRATVDREPPHAAGERDGATYVMGRRVGIDTRVVDVRCSLAPGQRRDLDLATFPGVDFALAPLPVDLLAQFGGWPSVNGAPLAVVSVVPDGAGWTAALRARVPGTRLLVCDLWITWYPAQGWCHGEALLTASNPTVPDVTEDAPAITLAFGDAVVAPLGGAVGQLAPAAHWGDGQARGVPLTFVWTRNMPAVDWSQPWGDDEWRWIGAYMSAEADKTLLVRGVGIDRLLANGNPSLPGGLSPLAWAQGRLGGALAALHSWDEGTSGPVKESGITGAQVNDQLFVRGEAMRADGVGAELVAYFGALKYGGRPCHHREADGSPLDAARHTQRPLIFWDGRPHAGLWSMVDRLGKDKVLNWDPDRFEMFPDKRESSGWWGPDVEHWLMNQLAAGCRLTGSPCLQALLRAQATIYPLQWTTTPGWSTSDHYASRAVGYEMLNAVHMWRELEDRALAQRIRTHALNRWAVSIAPAYGGDVWDWRTGDARFPAGGSWWMPWQQSIAAYGLDLAGEQFGVPAMRETALRGALRVLNDGIRYDAALGFYYTVKSICDDGRVDPWGGYWLFGTPLAVAVVLRQQPTNEKARAVWAQMVADATQPEQTSWLAPGVQ
jgi:hypothetical protein